MTMFVDQVHQQMYISLRRTNIGHAAFAFALYGLGSQHLPSLVDSLKEVSTDGDHGGMRSYPLEHPQLT